MLNLNPQFKTACRTCRDRKVKCDKVLPCRNCSVASITCSYPPQVRTVRRPKRAINRSTNNKETKTIHDRLNRLESLLKKHAPHLELEEENSSDKGTAEHSQGDMQNDAYSHLAISGYVGGTEHAPHTPSSAEGTHAFPPNGVPRIAENERAALDGAFSDTIYWDQLDQGCASDVLIKTPSTTQSLQAHGNSSDQEKTPSVHLEKKTIADSGFAGFPFRVPDCLTPPPLLLCTHREVCWKRYVESVDPLLKILHKPTVESLILVRDVHCYRSSPSTVALIQAMCLLAIVSMSEEDVLTNLGLDKETLMKECESLTEQALTASDFLDARDITTVQALMLYLYYLKCNEDSRLYSLCGVAVYLAARMRLGRESLHSGLSRVDIELRRRLWWQLVTLVDHPDETGLECFRFSVKADAGLPLNIDDCELERYGSDLSEERRGFTESSFCLMQYEITQTFNQIRSDRGRASDTHRMTAYGAEQRLQSSREAMQSKYFNGQMGTRPIGKFAADAIAMILAKRRLLVRLSPDLSRQNPPSPEVQDHLFLLGIHVLELSRKLQTIRHYERWRWLSGTYFQWTIASFVVKQLAVRQETQTTRRAWNVVDGILNNWPKATQESSRASLLKGLIAEAVRHRETENLWTFNMSFSPIQDYQEQSYPQPEVGGRKKQQAGRKGEVSADWTANNTLPSCPQSGLLSLYGALDLDSRFVSDLNFGETGLTMDFDMI